MTKKAFTMVSLFLMSVLILSACGNLRDTADKIEKLNETLPYYELNTADYSEISYDGTTYVITDICLNRTHLEEEIGQVSKRFKNVEGKDFSFGYVYRIENVDTSVAVAVNINNEYRQATAKATTD